eukprot:TRINITY_DN3119_c1_g1_i4.p1 TRINITY_DN3119_c1_g1~~TRINITY_DN3119_c1_g1_i4.p1  ORF type:complete len:620 (-),score=166.80 TRINITY_DN3119_c1_g1_i4:204-1931(-)
MTKYIPLRLTENERQMLNILLGALSSSEYTDHVDVRTNRNKAGIITTQIGNILSYISGFSFACDLKWDDKKVVFNNKQFEENEVLFQSVFEVGRRYKIMNPDKMRSDYGKMLYLLQDSLMYKDELKDEHGVGLKIPIKTVFDFLKRNDGLDLLSDPDISIAISELVNDPSEVLSKPSKKSKSEPESTTTTTNSTTTTTSTNDTNTITTTVSTSDATDSTTTISTTDNKSTLEDGGDNMDVETTSTSTSTTPSIQTPTSPSTSTSTPPSQDSSDSTNSTVNPNKKLINQKEEIIKQLCNKYATEKLSRDDIMHCISSLTDAKSFLNSNAEPVQKMILYLTKYFNPSQSDSKYSLSISSGTNGARLSHSHKQQYFYVLQSLMLWREIMMNFFKLWMCAENDLLNQNNCSYRLINTGQGLNRVQSAPQVGKMMNNILNKVQKAANGWIGSSVVHLGDHNVPNAFIFIDKYTQVPRILVPIVSTLEAIDRLYQTDSKAKMFIQISYGSAEKCKKEILADFFRHGFDGSGADNYFDAGSCIDGRLTSAWNWCSKLEKKKYFPIFLLCGFIGFDGKFTQQR